MEIFHGKNINSGKSTNQNTGSHWADMSQIADDVQLSNTLNGQMAAILQTTILSTFSWIRKTLYFYSDFTPVPNGPIDNNSAFAQVMALCRTDEKPLTEPVTTQFTHVYMCYLAYTYLLDSSSLSSWIHWVHVYCIWWYMSGDFSSGVWQSVRKPWREMMLCFPQTHATSVTTCTQKIALAHILKIKYFKPRQRHYVRNQLVNTFAD